MTLLYLTLAWLGGIIAGSILAVSPDVAILAGFLPLILGLFGRKRRWVRLLAVCALVFLAGLIRYRMSLPQTTPATISYYVDQGRMTLGAVVTEEPDVRDRYTNLRLQVYQVRVGERWRPVTGLIQATVPRFPAYAYGDNLELTGLLELPPTFEEFSYRDYLARQGVYALMRLPRVVLLRQGEGNPFLALLYGFKARLQGIIAQALPEPHAALLMGILLGIKSALPADLSAALATVGLTHIVVVSGYNLSVIAGVLGSLTEKRLGPRLALLASLAGVFAFTLMTGASAAVVRAAIMVSLTLLARYLGRQTEALTSLGLAAALMAGLNPQIPWDIGFQLSFLATLGLVSVSPLLEKWLQGLPALVRSPLAVTLAAQIMTTPVIVGNFQRLSLIAPLSNLLVLPVVPILMALGAVLLGVGLFWPAGATLIGWGIWVFSTYAVTVITTLAQWPLASIELPGFPLPLAMAYFALVLLVVYVDNHGGGLGRRAWTQAILTPLLNLPTRYLIAVLFVIALLVWTIALWPHP